MRLKGTVSGCYTPVCCLLGASFGTRNLGVNALASSTVSSVLHCSPEARVFFLDYGKSPATYHVKHDAGTANVELLNIRFSWKLHLRNNIARLLAAALVLRLVPSKSMRERLIRGNPYLEQISSADMIGSLAGGDSFSDVYGLRRLLYVALPQILVLLMGKPLTLLPQTLGPFMGRTARVIGGLILRHAEQTYARDWQSLDEVRPLLGRHQSKLRFCYDMAFLLEPIPPARKPDWLRPKGQITPLVGLNVSGLLYSGGYARNNMFGLRSDYGELIREIIRYLVVEKGAQVVLVPHVFGAEGDVESDTAAGAAIYRECQGRYRNRLKLISEEYDEHETKWLIGQCDFFVGSRMHACIAALSQGVPAVALAYSRKFLGVLQTVGAASLVVDLRKCEAPEVIRVIEGAFIAREGIRVDLARRMLAVKEAVAALFTRTLSPGRSPANAGAMAELDGNGMGVQVEGTQG